MRFIEMLRPATELNRYGSKIIFGNYMVFLVLTKNGIKEVTELSPHAEISIWISGGVLNNDEILNLRKSGVDLTNFSYQIDPADLSQINEAINTISEHHPGQKIWVENQSAF